MIRPLLVELSYFEGCPHWRELDARLAALQREFGFELTHRIIRSPEDADDYGFLGSPSVRVNGLDPFASSDAPVGLACRTYETPDGRAGSPTLAQLRSALATAAEAAATEAAATEEGDQSS
ncbi:thioredoxin family protein [Rhabdothermincola sp.]|uniref:thioredoxin family protein n=1 Tax=Rhabdothermincola sp. TaxID=2820405 RepID=UPI002FE00D52